MSKVGYARVSSTGQSLEIQIEKLNTVGCSKIFAEKISGTQTENRDELVKCLDYLREEDTLVITKLDRLARSVFDLNKILDRLNNNKINFQVVDQNIDTTTPTGRLLFQVLGSIAEFENDLRKERQIEGIRNALVRGIKFGRQAKLSTEQVEEMKRERSLGVSIAELKKEYGLSRESIYRILRNNSLKRMEQ